MEIKSDLISELPNCVLEHIVSFLSLKEAAKTSILSLGWRHIWTNTNSPHLTIDVFDEELSPVLKRKELVTRAEQIITQYFQGKTIESLKVATDYTDQYSWYIDIWIELAVKSRVKKIELALTARFILLNRIIPVVHKYKFPHKLSSAALTNIEELHLQSCIIETPRNFGGFSFLKILRLQHVIMGQEFVTNVSYVCENLQELMLERCDLGSLNLEIRDWRLMHLKVISCVNTSLIVIFSPWLTTFEYIGDIQHISLCEAPQLQMVFLWPAFTGFPKALRIFPTLPQLQSIVLNLSEKQVMELPENIGELRSLKDIRIYITSYSKNFELFRIPSILEAFPHLQKLVLVLSGATSDQGEYNVKQHEAFRHLQLKEFEMHGCVGDWYELELAMLVLRGAINLERVVIGHSKAVYAGNGEWMDLLEGSHLHRSLYESRKEGIRRILQDYIPPTLNNFVML